MDTIPQTSEQLTYRIRHQWIGSKGAGYDLCDAIDAETGTPLPGTDSLTEEMLRWRMRKDYPWYVEKGTVRA